MPLTLGVRYFFLYLFALPGLEFRAFTLSHSTSPFCDGFFEIESQNYLPRLAWNCDLPDLGLLSS
jgi:hypothetical protein